MEKLIITEGAREVFQKVNSETLLNRNQKRNLTSIIQNEDIELSSEDIDEWGISVNSLRNEDLTKNQIEVLEKSINLILDFLESCIIEENI